jgi:hypothetical protein
MSAKDYVRSLAAEIVGLGIDKTETIGEASGIDGASSSIAGLEAAAGTGQFAAETIADEKLLAAQAHAKDNIGGADPLFVRLLGHAVIDIWGDLPRDLQEALFEASAQARPDQRTSLATYLHERHPRTGAPLGPSALA